MHPSVGSLTMATSCLAICVAAAGAAGGSDGPGLPGFSDAVTDSLHGFADTQGAQGWWYGYTAPGADDFRPLDRLEAGWWRQGNGDLPAISATELRAAPGLVPIRRWVPTTAGSVRLVGTVRKPSAAVAVEFRILQDGKLLWSRRLDRSDVLRHAFDIVACELTTASTVDCLAVADAGSPPVSVVMGFEVIPEPFVSRWRADLPTGFPEVAEIEQQRQRDRGQAILQQLREVSAAGGGRVTIPPGDYRFHANWSRASTLQGLANLEIEAQGATFWFEPPLVHALLFQDCHDVTVRGLTIDCTIPPWFQARVVAVDHGKNTIQASLMPGYRPRNANGEPETDGSRAMMFYDAAGRFINHRHAPGTWRLTDDGAGVTCEVGRNGVPVALQPGDYVVGTIRTGAALRSVNCARMRFEDVNIWSSPGIAVNEGGGEGGHVYLRLRATRRPHTNRLQAFGADVYHLAGTDHGPILDRCEAAYGADDILNIHGSFGRVVQAAGERRYYLEGAYEVGDTVEFREPSSVALLGIAKAIAVQATPNGPSLPINDRYAAKGEWLVQLDQDLELPPLSLVVLDGKRSAEGWVVRNCWFHDDFQRTLINGSPGGLIENTTLQNLGHGLCVQFETWGPWMEGPFARDLVIRNNRFLDSPPDGAAISVSMHPPGGGSNRRRFEARPVTNMGITGNYFARTTGPAAMIHNVEGLRIQGNCVDRDAGDSDWLALQDCGDVLLEQNEVAGADAP